MVYNPSNNIIQHDNNNSKSFLLMKSSLPILFVGNRGSIMNLIRFSRRPVIILVKTGQPVSIQGLVLNSISIGLKLLEIIKSKPYNSNPKI